MRSPSPAGDADPTFSFRTRQGLLNQLSEREFDLLVVGGGITGAAIAHLAARRGLRVALVEKGDFASGTSSRSSRLIHGGLRYLRHGQVRIVYHSLREQLVLAGTAPHLVRRQSFLLPVYRGSPVPPWMISLLVAVYHGLRPRRSGLAYEHLTPRATLRLEGLLRQDGLLGALLYHEFATHDARLVLETVLAARAEGAATLNYIGLVDLLVGGGRVAGGVLQDQLTRQVVDVRAKAVVNAAGPWSDALVRTLDPKRHRLRLTKGVHIILPHRRLPLSVGVNLFSPRDGRAFMARPAGNLVFVGPTETEYEGDPAAVTAEPVDRDYLLQTINAYFPAVRISSADVVGMTAGLRPLYDRPGRAAGEVSRSYEIVWGPEGLLSVLGGKLTLHRLAAQEAVRFLEPRFGHGPMSPDGAAPLLPGGRWDQPAIRIGAQLGACGVTPETIEHLMATNGGRSAALPEMLRDHPEWGEPLVPGLPHIWAEIPFARESEMAVKPEDYLLRRSDLALMAAAAGRALPETIGPLWESLSGRVPVRQST